MSRRLGLVIGVNHYQDSTFYPLQFAENDARALAQWLVNAQGGKWSPGDVQLVQGQHATQELVQPLLSQLCLQIAEADDLVLIYFAGHAFLDERSGESYLALSNSRYQQPSSALHLSTFITQVMARSRAAHILLILDCFQTGPAWRARRTSPYDSKPLMGEALVASLQQQTNRLLLCTCRGNEAVPESGERQLGLFAHRMIVGLCGPADNTSTGSITLQQLHAYLYSTLGKQQQPHLFGRIQSPMYLVGALPATSQSPSTPVPERQSQTFSSRSSYNTTDQPLPTSTPQSRQPGRHAATAQLSPHPDMPASSSFYPGSKVEPSRQQIPQLLEQAQQLVLAQNYSGAMNTIEQALQIAPADPSALTLKAQILGSMARYQEALAVVDQLGQLNPQNPLAWSMRAVLLSNTGQYQAALAAVERSLALNPGDPETQTIKTNIMAALNGSPANNQPYASSLASSSKLPGEQKRGGPLSFLIGAALQIVGFLAGTVGMVLPILQPALPVFVGFVLASFGLALLCVNSFRGAYRHGFARLLLTLFVCVIAGGILAAAYKFGMTMVQTHPSMIVSFILFGAWLAAAATIPLLLAIIGFISRLIWHRRG